MKGRVVKPRVAGQKFAQIRFEGFEEVAKALRAAHVRTQDLKRFLTAQISDFTEAAKRVLSRKKPKA